MRKGKKIKRIVAVISAAAVLLLAVAGIWKNGDISLGWKLLMMKHTRKSNN